MKKMLFAAAIAVLASVPQILKAQEAEAPNPDALEAKDSGTGKTGGKAASKAAADKNKEAEKASQFAERQKTINDIMEKLKKATRNSDKRKYREQLLREQRNYQSDVSRVRKPLEDQVKPLKERIRYNRGEKKQQLEKELADLEQKLQEVDKEADLEKWCAKPETQTKDSPDPGPGKKAAKTKKNKKSKKSKKSKGK